MEGVSRLPNLSADAPEITPLSTLVNYRLVEALQGQHPLQFSFGHSERWVYYQDGLAAGLLIISVVPSSRTAVLEWLYIVDNYRRKGIASKLLQAALPVLKSLKIEILSVFFSKNTADSPAIESLLKKFHWEPSKHFVFRYKFDAPGFNPPWLSREVHLPEGYSFFPWIEISARERTALEYRIDQFQIPLSVSPFGDARRLEKKSSVGIRSKGKVVGWCINHWIDAESVEFSSLYVDPELSALGLGPAALIRSIRLVQLNPAIRFAWMTIRDNDPAAGTWVNFVNKRLSREAIEIQDIHESFVKLLFTPCI